MIYGLWTQSLGFGVVYLEHWQGDKSRRGIQTEIGSGGGRGGRVRGKRKVGGEKGGVQGMHHILL